jgi:ribonucleotide monophosphatase NagD (HAD superfamily)
LASLRSGQGALSGDRLIPGAAETIDTLPEMKISPDIVTNNLTNTRHEIAGIAAEEKYSLQSELDYTKEEKRNLQSERATAKEEKFC